MRGYKDDQCYMFSYISAEERVPKDHPLRMVKAFADDILRNMSGTFDTMYSHTGRPSIPPERLLKSILLMALYTVRSDRLFCESLYYNILFRWFLDMSLDERSFDASSFSKNRERLMRHDVAQEFFDAVVEYARVEDLLSYEHFTVDGTLVEAFASLKSFTPKGSGKAASSDDDPSNPTVDFHGEKRSNRTHESTTDPDARLMRKAKGKEAKLSYSCNVLMENRNGLLVDLKLLSATGKAEHESLEMMLNRQADKGIVPKTLGGDKGYHSSGVVFDLLTRGVKPHIAMVKGRNVYGIDGRTARSSGYKISQRIRKRIEEIFGWMKTVGGLRKTRYRGVERVFEHGLFVGAAYNLLRMSKLLADTG